MTNLLQVISKARQDQQYQARREKETAKSNSRRVALNLDWAEGYPDGGDSHVSPRSHGGLEPVRSQVPSQLRKRTKLKPTDRRSSPGDPVPSNHEARWISRVFRVRYEVSSRILLWRIGTTFETCALRCASLGFEDRNAMGTRTCTRRGRSDLVYRCAYGRIRCKASNHHSQEHVFFI
uniref:Uncharacterized protein n=1 Tax=Coccidioides posadasii RMSCC 3488 TaxID=454284 RepID=A0A0J6I5L0_COCPO|nr:hypothetical protein CPAG_03010 [Coccidioides posadasii RMSCC 3488]